MEKISKGDRQREDAGARKRRFAKAAGAEPAGQMKDEQLHAVVAGSNFVCEKRSTPCLGH